MTTLPKMPQEPKYSPHIMPGAQWLIYHKERAAVLEAWLKEAMRYAGHHSGCAEYHGANDDCTCGLSALRAYLEASSKLRLVDGVIVSDKKLVLADLRTLQAHLEGEK